MTHHIFFSFSFAHFRPNYKSIWDDVEAFFLDNYRSYFENSIHCRYNFLKF